MIAGRELLIYCDKNDIQAQNFESITFCDMQNEIAISGLQRIGFNSSNILKLYTGLGGQLGTTVRSQFWVFSSLLEEDDATGETVFNEMSFDTRSSMFGRLYVPFGAELVAFKKISVGAEARLGYGLQQVVGRKSYGGLNYGFKLSAGWIF